jgi:hypothetical protein
MNCRLLVVLGLMLVTAVARGGVQDPDYAFRPTQQRDWARRRVRQILGPTVTYPALVRLGGKLEIRLRIRRSSRLRRLGVERPDRWAVDLRPAGGNALNPCRVLEVRGLDVPRGGLVLVVAVPVHLARDVYDLDVVGPGIDDSQPNAVRIYGETEPERFRFAVITDHQLWDPSHRVSSRAINTGSFPRRGGDADNLAITRQEFAELALWDPEFVLHLGDLIFGVNYPAEYDEAFELLADAGLPVFAVPGNHDGYADYVVRLRGGALKILTGALGCKKHLAGELSWNKVWVFITCVYGDVKEMLYTDLHRDGLVYWRRQFGPTVYAFDHGKIHFVGINTYDGSPERRHAFSIYMDAFDLHLGAPAVDNYGGYLTAEQLRFIKQEAARATERGQTLVFFGHHDPRGNEGGQRCHANEPFPTDPLGIAGFEEWNFDSKSWDSDPKDRRGTETEGKNSGHALLAILAEHGGYYLSGHGHQDGRRVYEPGSSLPGGIKVKRRLEFIRTTTAAAGVRGDGYWGYRLIEVKGGRLGAVDYAPEHRLSSLPAGNIWVTRDKDALGSSPPSKAQGRRSDETPVLDLTSGLPRPAKPVVRWELPTRVEGYRFRLAAGETGRPQDPSRIEHPTVRQIEQRGAATVYWVAVSMPAAAYPPRAEQLVRRRLRALVARGNRAPQAVIDVAPAGGLKLQPLDAQFEGVIGQPVLLSAERSADPDGDRIISYLWSLGDEHQARGKRLVHRFTTPGSRVVKLTLIDEAGARSTVEGTLRIVAPLPPQAPEPPGCRGCCASGARVAGLALPGLALLGLVLAGWWRRRRGRRS